MIKDGNYYTVLGWMRNRLGLTGNEATVYAIIYGFCQDKINTYELGIGYITDWIGESEWTVRRILKNLIFKGVITEEQRSGKTSIYRCVPLANCYPLQIATPCTDATTTPCKLQPLPLANCNPIINNNIKDKEVVVERTCASALAPTTQTSTTTSSFSLFNSWWETYGMVEFGSQREQCLKFWMVLTENECRQVQAHTNLFAPINLQRPKNKRKQPYFYLCEDKMWKDDLSTLKNDELHVLDGREAESEKKNGTDVWNCKLPNGGYGFVTEDDANRMGLKKLWKF